MKLSSSRLDMETARLERPTIKNYHETVAGGTAGTNTTSSYTVDISAGNIHNLNLVVATTTLTFTNPPAWGNHGKLTLILRQDATGGRTVVWPAEVQWPSGSAPTLTTAPNAIDVITFSTFDNGSTWHGAASLTDSKRLRTLWSFGKNDLGQLGDGTAVNKSSPVQIGTLTNWASIVSGGGSALTSVLATKTDGTLWAFGRNHYGQLGDQTTINKSSPVQIGALTNWANAAHGGTHSLATKTDGTLWAFGYNQGYLGDNTVTQRSSPVQIGSLTDWSRVACGERHSMALKNDGSLWSWGYADSGRLGNNSVTGRVSSPVRIGSLADWSIVSGGRDHSLAIKRDGTLWSFGKNGSGQIGDQTTINKSSPVQIGALTNWASVAGNNHSLATKTDGTLWAWGSNSSGQLGDQTTINKSSPVQIGALTNWASVMSGQSHSLAIKTDGTLWAFGYNYFGQVGNRSVVDVSSPVQIGSLINWASVVGGGTNSIALQKG